MSSVPLAHALITPRPRAVFVGHDIYRQAAYGNNHPLTIPRVETVMDLCRALDWFAPGEFRVSPQASESELLHYHTAEYVAALRNATRLARVDVATRQRFAIGTMENPIFAGLFERAATSVGGSIHAAELAMTGYVAFHPAGGTHHGRPDRASGFCYFNDPVFAILRLLQGGVERVLYVDLDAHHGDAVQDTFAEDERVYLVSIHEAGRWPHTGRVSDHCHGRACNLPVPKDFTDGELALLMDRVVQPFQALVAPQAVVLTCGADALEGDPLSSMRLSNTALWSAVERVVSRTPKAVVLGGGGYNPWTVARYWTGIWGCLSGRPIPPNLPESAMRVLQRLECDLVDDEAMRPAWLTTLADVPGSTSVRQEVEALAARARDELGCFAESTSAGAPAQKHLAEVARK